MKMIINITLLLTACGVLRQNKRAGLKNHPLRPANGYFKMNEVQDFEKFRFELIQD